jgi:hypothetical protein
VAFFLSDWREGFVFSVMYLWGKPQPGPQELSPEDWNAEGAKLPRGYVAENTSPGDSEPKKNGHILYPFISYSPQVRFKRMNLIWHSSFVWNWDFDICHLCGIAPCILNRSGLQMNKA